MNITDPIAEFLGSWSSGINIYSIIFRTALCIIFASVIGCERSSKRHAAGLRTFILVSLASEMAMLLDIFLIESLRFPVPGITADSVTISLPLISTATVIGVAIIGTNSILFSSRSQIKGLTTSFGLWTCGILGLTIGAGFYSASIVLFTAVIVCLSAFPPFEAYLKNRSNHFEIHLELKNKSNLQDFVATIRKLGLCIEDIELNPAYMNSGLSVYSISLTIKGKELRRYKKHSEIIEALSTLDYVYFIEEMN